MGERLVEDLQHVWRSTTRAEADARLTRLLLKIRPYYAPLADCPEDTAANTLCVYALCEEDGCKRLATTDSIEYDHIAVRRTHVIWVYPNEASFLRLASALASERHEQSIFRRYVTAQQDLKHPLLKSAA